MSLFADILRDTQLAIRDLNLVHNVVRRKSERYGADEPLPAIVVSPEREILDSLHSENAACWRFPVVVTFYQAGNGDLESQVDNFLDWRDAVLKRFHKPNALANVTAVYDCDVDLSEPFEPRIIPVNLDVSQLRLYFLAEDIRAS